LLENVPNIGKITLLIRRNRTTSAQRRFEKILEESPAFDTLQARHGRQLAAFLKQKVEVVEGDVSQPGLGMDEATQERLAKSLDLIVNSAGLTDFNPDLREALASNVDSAIHLLDFLRKSDHAGLMHLSTCYVVGMRDGRVGEELHDNINQMLAGAKLYLSVAGNSNEELKNALQYPVKLLDDTMNEIRLLTKRSVTPKQNINLKELIQTLVDTIFKNASFKICSKFKDVDDKLEDELKLNIYRNIQEQTNNILKHANAANVVISISAGNYIVDIAVTDDGNGFDTSKKREGIGISNIINRVESFNGEVRIESAPGYGCKLLIKIPF